MIEGATRGGGEGSVVAAGPIVNEVGEVATGAAEGFTTGGDDGLAIGAGLDGGSTPGNCCEIGVGERVVSTGGDEGMDTNSTDAVVGKSASVGEGLEIGAVVKGVGVVENSPVAGGSEMGAVEGVTAGGCDEPETGSIVGNGAVVKVSLVTGD